MTCSGHRCVFYKKAGGESYQETKMTLYVINTGAFEINRLMTKSGRSKELAGLQVFISCFVILFYFVIIFNFSVSGVF